MQPAKTAFLEMGGAHSTVNIEIDEKVRVSIRDDIAFIMVDGSTYSNFPIPCHIVGFHQVFKFIMGVAPYFIPTP